MRKIYLILLCIVYFEVFYVNSQSLEGLNDPGSYIFHEDFPSSTISTLQWNSDASWTLGGNFKMPDLPILIKTFSDENNKKSDTETSLQHENNQKASIHASNEELLHEAHPYRMARKRKKIQFPFFSKKKDEGKKPEKRNDKKKKNCFNCQKYIDDKHPKSTTLGAYDIGEKLSFYQSNNKEKSTGEEIKPSPEPLFNARSHLKYNSDPFPAMIHNSRQKFLYDSVDNHNEYADLQKSLDGKENKAAKEFEDDLAPSNEDNSRTFAEEAEKYETKRGEDDKASNEGYQEQNYDANARFDERGEQRLKELEVVQKKIESIGQKLSAKTRETAQSSIMFHPVIFV